MVTLGNDESTSGHVDTLAFDLFTAIVKLDYKNIEKLVKTNRNKGLLNAKDKDGNTFIHLVAYLILRTRPNNIPDIDDSAPLMQDVINSFRTLFLHLCKIINSNLFYAFADLA